VIGFTESATATESITTQMAEGSHSFLVFDPYIRRYEGEWVDDKAHGKGMCLYASGNRYGESPFNLWFTF